MAFILNISYSLEALFAAFRISLWFILLFGFIAPLFLKHTRKLPGIEKLVYSWVGLGGVIIFSVFVLSVLHIYDFISIVLTLLLIPLVINIMESSEGVVSYFKKLEYRAIISQVTFIERFEGIKWSRIKEHFRSRESQSGFQISQTVLVICIALLGGLIRMYPALLNAAPFSRNWFFELNRVKNIRLQDYFSSYPEPSGMHSLVSVFSMVTQVSPEMILHLLGALSSFFLCVLIYVAIKDITRNEYPMAPIFGMAVYAITPMLLMPLSLDLQIEGNSLDLALCFAIPTLMIFVRNLRATYKSPWFYVLSGFIATGMTNLFVAFVILLPLMLIGLFSLPRRRYIKSFIKVFSYLLLISAVILGPIIIYNFTHGIDQVSFFLQRLYDTKVYSYFPLLIYPQNELSVIYLWIAGFMLLGYAIEKLVSRKNGVRDEIIFLLIFSGLSIIYSPLLEGVSLLIDVDQLNAFYSIMIAITAGILFSSLLRWSNLLFRLKDTAIRVVGILLFVVCVSGLIYQQGGIRVSRQLPTTIPNGFHQSYYKIIDDFLPYSYATVAPQLERITAKNRHYFMDYEYFLDEYSEQDSLYHEQLLNSNADRTAANVLPPSIFIFLEKPPYNEIQQGILYDSPSVMRDLEQWLLSFKKLENRTLEIYYEDQNTIVYQIINRRNASQIGDILLNIRPREKEITDG